ncbi:hypothetical protein ADUPG1_002877 [Aduncisulcus paluster]|uniref:Chromo domain-containing protein n=1 Tax=Aduncisulcus paluster TaxID=2918883 RepID=A0ABQ5KQR8_9EUKA|nr:hypothetical protein ADUPG1_002877 [Aduncisulcus paluster]
MKEVDRYRFTVKWLGYKDPYDGETYKSICHTPAFNTYCNTRPTLKKIFDSAMKGKTGSRRRKKVKWSSGSSIEDEDSFDSSYSDENESSDSKEDVVETAVLRRRGSRKKPSETPSRPSEETQTSSDETHLEDETQKDEEDTPSEKEGEEEASERERRGTCRTHVGDNPKSSQAKPRKGKPRGRKRKPKRKQTPSYDDSDSDETYQPPASLRRNTRKTRKESR